MIDFHAVNQRLLTDLLFYARSWVPSGKVVGCNYIALNPRRADRRLGSFCLNLKEGFWSDFATEDRGGDPVSYFAYVNGLSQFEAGKILSSSTGVGVRKNTLANLTKVFKSPEVTIEKNGYCQKIWRETRPAAGALVERYLTMRGISGSIPESIRFHPSLYHMPSKQNHPCMISAIVRWPGKILIGVHRTYLDLLTGTKALIEPNKMMLGKVCGGAVRLSHLSDVLIVSEGIETALSILQVRPEATVWAALSAGGIKSLLLPNLPFAKTIIIAADHDSVGIKAAVHAAALWVSEGRIVKIALPTKKGEDFNDMLKGV